MLEKLEVVIYPKLAYTINDERTAFDHGKLAGSVYLDDSNDDRQSETAAETENTYISETVKSTVKIPTTNLGFRWKIVSVSKYNSDRPPEISIWRQNRK